MFSFSAAQLQKCAKSIAIMVVRFKPEGSIIYSAKSIARFLTSLPYGNSSSLFVDVSSQSCLEEGVETKIAIVAEEFVACVSNLNPAISTGLVSLEYSAKVV